jgi:hypothetical protein
MEIKDFTSRRGVCLAWALLILNRKFGLKIKTGGISTERMFQYFYY